MNDVNSGLAVTGLREETPSNMLLSAGTVYKNLVFDTASSAWNGVIVGATSGGNKFIYKPGITSVDIDGVHVKTEGLDIKQGEEASLEVNLVEVTAGSVKRAMMGTVAKDEVTGFSVIETKANLTAEDYEDNVAFVGFRNDGQPVIIILGKAICLDGLELEGKSKDKSVIKYKFQCVSPRKDAGKGILPIKIYMPEDTAE